MAIDTEAKRMQALSASTLVLPLADDSVAVEDRALLVWVFYQAAAAFASLIYGTVRGVSGIGTVKG